MSTIEIVIDSLHPARLARFWAEALPGYRVRFQQTERPKTGRNRIHLDLRCRDRAAECARLSAPGARVRDEHPHHTVMLDPEGNEFRLVEAAPDDGAAS